MSKRNLVLGLLAFTALLGFGSGFAHLAGHGWHHDGRRARFEARVADVCVEAADRRLERARRGDADRHDRRHDRGYGDRWDGGHDGPRRDTR